MSDLQIAIAEKSFNDIIKASIKLGAVLPVFKAPVTELGNGLSYSCDFGLKLTDGSVDFRADNAGGNVLLKEFDITWDPLILNFFLDIPKVEIGCECFTIGFGGFSKTICLPCIELFEDETDITVAVDLSHIFVHEFSGEFAMRIEDWKLNERTDLGLTDFEATLTEDSTDEVRDDIKDRFIARLPPIVPPIWIQNLSQRIVENLGLKTSLADKTRFYFEGNKWTDIDVIDIAGTVANILTKIKDAIINELLSFVPASVRAILNDLLSAVISGIETVLDFPDDLEEFINDFFNVSFGMVDFTVKILLAYVTQVPLFQIEKPHKIIDAGNKEFPLLIPYENFNAVFKNEELIIEADTNIL